MFEFYKKTQDPKVIKTTFKSLKKIYDVIPETEGCMENIDKEDGCGAWCCKTQSPSLFFGEFLYSWNDIIHQWSWPEIVELLEKSIRNYFSNDLTNKGCVMWDAGNKTCKIHFRRPFNCRLYGQIPADEFKSRFEKLKVLYGENSDIKPQCALCKTKGQALTTGEIDLYFKDLQETDIDLGVTKTNDSDEGSYRTFHDHILLKFGSEGFLSKLTELKQNGKEEEKEKFIQDFKEKLFENYQNRLSEGADSKSQNNKG